MKIYRFLSKVKFLNSYSIKLLFIAVVGIHIPLIGLAIFLSSRLAANINTEQVFLLTFGLTFLASALSLYILNEMVVPVKRAKNALRTYMTERKLPHLPTHYTDEVGVLMRSVQKTLESLDDLIKEKQDMMALISHDLRSPISTTISLAELIKLENKDEEIHDYCDKIIEQNEKQLHLIQTVLNMLRQDHFYVEEAEKYPHQLTDLISKAVRSLEVDLTQKNISLINEVPAALEVKVQQDTFLQVLINIIHNAIKFSPRNSPITVSAQRLGKKINIQIQDYGIGFESEKDQEKVFERFTSLRREGTEGEPTTGIGLYLCKKILQRHKGEIYLTSEGSHKGSTFHIILPV